METSKPKNFNKKIKECRDAYTVAKVKEQRDDSCKSKGTRWDDACKSKGTRWDVLAKVKEQDGTTLAKVKEQDANLARNNSAMRA